MVSLARSYRHICFMGLDIQLTLGRKCSFRFVDTSYWRSVLPLNGFVQTKSAVSQLLQKSGGVSLHQVCTYRSTIVLPPRLIYFMECLRNVIFPHPNSFLNYAQVKREKRRSNFIK